MMSSICRGFFWEAQWQIWTYQCNDLQFYTALLTVHFSETTVILKNQPVSNLSPGFSTKELQFYIAETTDFSKVNGWVTEE